MCRFRTDVGDGKRVKERLLGLEMGLLKGVLCGGVESEDEIADGEELVFKWEKGRGQIK
jgi:hypothetical protein